MKYIDIMPKSLLRQRLCWHRWTKTIEAKSPFGIPFFYRRCIKCGKRTEVHRVEVS